MKPALKSILFSAVVIILLSLNACNVTDQKMIVDQNTEIDNQNWSYNNKVANAFTIDDTGIPYNIYFNLRVTADYRYANIFVLIHQTGPDKKTASTRWEFKLANADGEWLGQGSGNLYNYQIPIKTNYRFPAKGKYTIQIEQNMRDNPLRNVSDVGLRVEKAQ